MKTRKCRRHYQRLNNASCKVSQEEYPEYLQLWIIRMLWYLGGHREFIDRHGFSSDFLKACFDYLKPEQAWQLFRKQCKLQSMSSRKKGLRKKLDWLTVLTPGDFAVIARSNRFDQITDAWQMIEQLEKECALKDSGHASIGFM